jgi:hypothetical protein
MVKDDFIRENYKDIKERGTVSDFELRNDYSYRHIFGYDFLEKLVRISEYDVIQEEINKNNVASK